MITHQSRSGVEDLWFYSGKPRTKQNQTARHGRGKRWRAKFVAPNGREVSKALDTKVEARRWLDGQTTAIGTDTYVDPHLRARFAEVAERYEAGLGHLSAKSLYNKRSLLKSRVLPKWGDRDIRTLLPSEINAWLADLVAERLSGSLVRKCAMTTRQVLDVAVRDRLLAHNPAEGAKLPKEGKGHEAVYLTPAQLGALARNCQGYEVLIWTLGVCGLRWSEATALEVRDLDFTRHRLTISKAYTTVAGKVDIGTTKTGRSRWVPVPATLETMLRGLVAGKDPCDLVFAAVRGGVLRERNFAQRTFGPAVRATEGAPNQMWVYDLRHTAASLAISAGANIKALQHMLGHATADMTLNRYGHLYEDDLASLSSALDSSLALVA